MDTCDWMVGTKPSEALVTVTVLLMYTLLLWLMKIKLYFYCSCCQEGINYDYHCYYYLTVQLCQ
jgi:hypothetical protein